MNVLVIGAKYRELSRFIPRYLRTEYSLDPPDVMHLDEWNYDPTLESFYLTFDVIVSPFRLCLMHIALAREKGDPHPWIVLATNAAEKIEHLVDGGVCDKVTQSYPPIICDALIALADCRSRPSQMDNRRMTAKRAFVDFMAYLGRDHHGHYHPWADAPLAEAYHEAWNYYERMKLAEMKKNNVMQISPAFPVHEYTCRPDLARAFVIMPFGPELTKVYEDIVKPTVLDCQVEVHRSDDFFTPGSVMNDVWRRIIEADFVIADLTARNPNVFYELGIAHSVGKPVILLAQDIDDVPFDIRDQRVITYGIRYDDVDKLRTALVASIEEIRRQHAARFGTQAV